MGNIFFHWHLWPTGNGLAAMGGFHFRDLEMTPLEVIQGQGQCGFRILGTEFLLMSLSNYGSVSHRLGAMDVESCLLQQQTDMHYRIRAMPHAASP